MGFALLFPRIFLVPVAVFIGLWSILVVLIFLTAPTLVAPPTLVVAPAPPKPTPFDFFLLVEQWGPAFCEVRKCPSIEPLKLPNLNFTIHGLWPQNYLGKQPLDCNPNDPFSPNELSAALKASMDINWLDYEGNNLNFWTYEWARHGTCSNLTQKDYFQLTIDKYLTPNYNIRKILVDAGIGYGSESTPSIISQAIRQATNFEPILNCKTTAAKKVILLEIGLCMNNVTRNFQDCVTTKHTSCGDVTTQKVVFVSPPPTEKMENL